MVACLLVCCGQGGCEVRLRSSRSTGLRGHSTTDHIRVLCMHSHSQPPASVPLVTVFTYCASIRDRRSDHHASVHRNHHHRRRRHRHHHHEPVRVTPDITVLHTVPQTRHIFTVRLENPYHVIQRQACHVCIGALSLQGNLYVRSGSPAPAKDPTPRS